MHTIRLLPAFLAAILYLLLSDGSVDGFTILVFIVMAGSVLWQLKWMIHLERELERDPMDIVLEEQLGKNKHTPTNDDDRRLK